MTFEIDMMSCDPYLLVFWCLAHTPKYLVYEPLTIQKMKGPTHLIRDKYIYISILLFMLAVKM